MCVAAWVVNLLDPEHSLELTDAKRPLALRRTHVLGRSSLLGRANVEMMPDHATESLTSSLLAPLQRCDPSCKYTTV